MTSYFTKTPTIFKLIFNQWHWSFNKKEKNIYLTFDDGPTPEITTWVLNELEKHNAKATFFCIGKNIALYPEIFKEIIKSGHAVGNHTQNHLNGWKTKKADYLNNVNEAQEIIEDYLNEIENTQNKTKNILKLFRPPYGRMRLNQSKKLRKSGFKIIMWSVLSADFDTEISGENCLKNVLNNAENGSIVVLHDSVKAFKNLKFVLPQLLKYYHNNGFVFSKIEV